MEDLLTASSVILDSLSDGVYVCDRDRRIVYWSKSAERITGWTAGRRASAAGASTTCSATSTRTATACAARSSARCIGR